MTTTPPRRWGRAAVSTLGLSIFATLTGILANHDTHTTHALLALPATGIMVFTYGLGTALAPTSPA